MARYECDWSPHRSSGTCDEFENQDAFALDLPNHVEKHADRERGGDVNAGDNDIVRLVELLRRRLSAGHRHRVIEKNFLGDVDARGSGRPQRDGAGMGVGPVSDILKDVLVLRERRLPDPRHVLSVHRVNVTVLPCGRNIAMP